MIKKLFSILAPFRLVLITVFFAGVIIDTFLEFRSDLILLAFCLLWILVGRLFKFNSTITFKAVLAFLILFLILFIFSQDKGYVERIATWIYLLLAIGIAQQFREVTS